MFCLEMHCHTSPTSGCATITPEEEIALFKNAGYSGLVSTNHLNMTTFRFMPDAPWKDKVTYFMQGYNSLKQAAGDDFDVLFAGEVNLSEPGQPYISNDYLIYGMTEEWLRGMQEINHMKIGDLHAAVREAGMLLVHAHPFRTNTHMPNENDLDGVEVFNGNPNHNSRNYMANFFAQVNGLIKTSGSDLHHGDVRPNGGILTQTRIRDNESLLRTLRSGEYMLLTPSDMTNMSRLG